MAAKLKPKRSYSSLKMIEKREIGQQFLNDTLKSKYYKHIKLTWSQDEEHGGIFNLEFSPSGRLVVAACELRAILMFDPTSRICVHRLPNAHGDSVNCICFCDERIFASGSDDYGITLWDTRMLREQVMKLSGHTSWVKSLAYDNITNLLVSSAFDGTIRTWDINNYSNSEHNGITIFNKEHVSRMQLSPAGDKLIISSSLGIDADEITIFHELDLQNFANDLQNNWDQTSSDYIGNSTLTRNIPERLNNILEYPDIPLCIPSFQVHPHGWCLVSRYFTKYHFQYTTVHDIQGSNVMRNQRRLSHFVEESDSGRGYIKEQSFSPDGRVIASPFAHGTRLLAFSSDCCEWCKSKKEEAGAEKLTEVKFLLSHSKSVCCSKFSPTHMMVATGCLGGKVAFHEPKL